MQHGTKNDWLFTQLTLQLSFTNTWIVFVFIALPSFSGITQREAPLFTKFHADNVTMRAPPATAVYAYVRMCVSTCTRESYNCVNKSNRTLCSSLRFSHGS